MDNQQLLNILDYLQRYLVSYIPKVLLAIITLLIGLWVIKAIKKLVSAQLEKQEVDVSLHNFLSGLISVILKILLVISVVSMVGIETTSFVAVLAAAGLAIGLALQGSLSNFAGGVLILIFRPYKVGDYIVANGHAGTVNSIQVFNTVLKTPDNVTVVIPNGVMSSTAITNYSTEDTRRVDMVFGIGYDSDISQAKSLLNDITAADERIFDDPAKQIIISELADSSVNITVRVWCKKEDYWDIFFEMQEKVKLEFDKHSISIPYPQTDVHLIKE